MTHITYYLAALSRAQHAEDEARAYRLLALAAMDRLAALEHQHAKQTEQMVALREEIRRYTAMRVLGVAYRPLSE